MAIRGGRGRSSWTLDGIEKAKKSPKSTSMTTAQFKKVDSGKVSESDLQKSFIETIELIPYKGRTLRDFVYAVPNGGFRTKRTASNLKKEGVKAGVPDLHCFVAVPPWHSLYIEMKTAKGDLTDSQRHLIPILRAEGHKVVICRSDQHALSELLKYLGIQVA